MIATEPRTAQRRSPEKANSKQHSRGLVSPARRLPPSSSAANTMTSLEFGRALQRVSVEKGTVSSAFQRSLRRAATHGPDESSADEEVENASPARGQGRSSSAMNVRSSDPVRIERSSTALGHRSREQQDALAVNTVPIDTLDQFR